MPETSSFTKVITVTKEFLMRTYVHPLVAEIEGLDIESELYIKMWANKPDLEEFQLGGAYNNQFKSKTELQSFETAFDDILVKHQIAAKYRSELLYFIVFLEDDSLQQSLANNQTNNLIEYARFILKLAVNSASHFDSMIRNSAYEKIHDPYCIEDFFAKKELLNKLPIEDIIEYRTRFEPDDLVEYIRIDIFDNELYVPYDLMFNLVSERKLRDFDGSEIANITVPAALQPTLFRFMVNHILEEHKRHDTRFYKALLNSGATIDDFKKYYNQYKRHALIKHNSMLKVASVISDYLFDNKLVPTKRSIASFIFDYLCLFKAIPLKKPAEFPTEYSELPKFYTSQGINMDTIRLMLKDFA